MPSNATYGVGASGRRAASAFAAARRGGGTSPAALVRCALFGCVTVCILTALYFTIMVLRKQREDGGPDATTLRSFVSAVQQEAPRAGVNDALRLRVGAQPRETPRPRRIVLSDGEGRWNTGVWPGWGEGSRSVLNWAAAGVVIDKQCPVACVFTRDQDASSADAVIMELVNHPKFGVSASVPIPWPSKRPNPKAAALPRATAIPAQLPLTGIFYYEAAQSYPDYSLTSAGVREHIDFSVTPSGGSTLPISMICPWGKRSSDFVAAPPSKASSRFMAYFNEHGVAGEYSALVRDLFDAAGPDKLHAFVHMRNRDMPLEAGGSPYSLATRLAFMGTYKFILVTEALVEEDWVEPDLSHVFAAGSVPVYIGAPNVHAFIPGPRSIVHARNFKTARELWEFLSFFDSDSPAAAAAYAEFFAWKDPAHDVLMLDEAGQNAQLGTGQGLVRDQLAPDDLQQQLIWWDVRPGPHSTLRDAGTLLAPGALTFDALAKHAWRSFRRQLDHCVHYAECRICEFVTLLT